MVIQNRKDFYQANKEDIVPLLLASGVTSQYLLDLWYSGVLRAVKKFCEKAGTNADVLGLLDSQQKAELKRRIRVLSKKTAAIIDKL